MRLTPTGMSEYQDGNEVGRYGRDISSNTTVFCWYHNGLRKYDEAAWAMDPDVARKLSVSIDYVVVANADDGAYAIDADEFHDHMEVIDGTEQCVAKESQSHVHRLGDPNDHLQGRLWLDCDNGHGGYHKDQNH